LTCIMSQTYPDWFAINQPGFELHCNMTKCMKRLALKSY